MKAIILAAGKGTRMLPLTKKVPKVLVEVNGRPFLAYVIKNLRSAGFTELGFVVGYKKENIIEFLQKNKIKATIIEQKEQLGTGHALLQAKQFCGKDDFIVLGGDNLWSADDFKQFNQKDKFNYISGIKVDHPEKYGVLIAENGLLQEIKEKPKRYVGNLVNAALYKFTAEIWSALEKVKLSERGEIELTDAVTLLAKERKVKIIEVKDYWLDLGCKEDVITIEKLMINQTQ